MSSSTTVPSTPVRDRVSYSINHSPRTPSTSAYTTPCTSSPFSGRSFSSTLTSPSSIKHSPRSPLYGKARKSVADLTDNWRERAQLNGIKVTAVETAQYTNEGMFVRMSQTANEADVSPASHHGWTNLPRRPLICSVSSLVQSSSNFSTPLPKANALQSLGCLTAPAVPRRRLFESPFLDLQPLGNSEAVATSAFSPVRKSSQDLLNPIQSSPAPDLCDLSSACSVCDKQPSSSSRMIVLSPCSHIFCSSCFTGTLNIVGEKNMSCMDCNSPIDSFHFALGDLDVAPDVLSKMDSAFKKPFVASSQITPNPSSPASTHGSRRDGIAVLRIDNVPWDVTPIVIEKFINRPIIEAHVLLDVKGKTLSHAFVQLSLEDARTALRSSQNAILGQGRRARAVTVTLSSQEELMIALYPHWRGKFHGSSPSLDGLNNEQITEALAHGLLSDVELQSLLNLITTPNSHFLKVPSLPFYSLISILSTFPSDVDSRIFWSSELRDSLFHITRAAFQVLLSRLEKIEGYVDLFKKLHKASINCRAFTDSQILMLEHWMKANALLLTSGDQTMNDLSNGCFETFRTIETLAAQLSLQPKALATILQSSRAFL